MHSRYSINDAIRGSCCTAHINLAGLNQTQHSIPLFSEMFIDPGRFSTRTVAAIHNLEGAEMRQKKEGDYQWRKEMEE